ncbi:unnamed protein product, partial [Brassica rapa subsp. narinosa]
MDFRDWDPGNRWRRGVYGRVGEIYSLGIKGFWKICEGDQPHPAEDFIGKGKLNYTRYWVKTRGSDRIWLTDLRLRGSQSKERDSVAKWISILILFITRSYNTILTWAWAREIVCWDKISGNQRVTAY